MGGKPRATVTRIASLMAQCDSGNHDIRRQTIRDLGHIGAREAIPMILSQVTSSDASVREAAAWALGELGRDDLDRAGSALDDLLLDPDELVRHEAAESLGFLRYRNARGSLERVLAHDDAWIVRASAAEALGHLGDVRAIDALMAAQNDDHHPVRTYAVYSIAQLGGEASLPFIKRRLTVEDHPQTRCELIHRALALGDDFAFDDLLALAEVVDDDHARDVFGAIKDLVAGHPPAVLEHRAAELERVLERLAQRTHADPVWAEIRPRLRAIASG